MDLREILMALGEVLQRADMFESHHIQREALSTRERMSQVLERLSEDRFVPFVSLFTYAEGRLGVVVTFLAILELVKESLIELIQSEPLGPIHVKARESAHEIEPEDEAEQPEGELETAFEAGAPPVLEQPDADADDVGAGQPESEDNNNVS